MYPKLRVAFGIVEALVIVLLVGGMLTLVLKYASIAPQHTINSYLQEQAILFLRSSIEHALLDISAYDRSGGQCWSQAHYSLDSGHGKSYHALIRAEHYYLKGEHCSNVPTHSIDTPESHGYVLLRVEVNATLDGVPKVRIIRKTLQHP